MCMHSLPSLWCRSIFTYPAMISFNLFRSHICLILLTYINNLIWYCMHCSSLNRVRVLSKSTIYYQLMHCSILIWVRVLSKSTINHQLVDIFCSVLLLRVPTCDESRDFIYRITTKNFVWINNDQLLTYG